MGNRTAWIRRIDRLNPQRLRQWVIPVCSAAWTRLRASTWPVLQATGAVTSAWMIARHVVAHHQPFFAPVAAVVALNTSRGDRGSNAIRLLLGVGAGITVGELTVSVGGSGYGSLAAATFIAMIVAVLLGAERLVLAQAAVSAILTVVAAAGQVGLDRLVDATIGAGVALLVSQVLFPPEPVALLRRAEAATLTHIADGLDLLVQALRSGNAALAGQATAQLAGIRDRLADLNHILDNSHRTARRAPLRWRYRTTLAREGHHAKQLDLLGSSGLMLARTAMTTSTHQQTALASVVGQLARALRTLATDLGNPAHHQQAVDQALTAARHVAEATTQPTAVRAAARTIATDIMLFAGLPADQITHAIRDKTVRPQIPEPPRPSRPSSPSWLWYPGR
jgi:uncharacterized membrane protein YgaE (UPF0421/DUF939 family)